MKLILIFIVIICFILIGYIIYRNFLRKKIFYNSLIDFCNLFLCNLEFKKDTVENIINNNLSSLCDDLKKCLSTFKINKSCDLIFLSKEENKTLYELLNRLGKNGDVENEKNYIHSEMEKLKIKQKLASDDEKVKGKVYFKLFVALGILIGIIIL